ncbi:MAG: hypothetical protein KAW12_14050 [Candidatus Aminicenantes bacterium]|nr:hypothetical protein [Candidatus Aminicenantes bacterium]
MQEDKMILNTLRKLHAAGHDGFEGLILKLIERLTGNRFYLSKSGFQAGGDMGAQIDGKTCIKIECKRYREDRPLDERSLQGELVQAHQKNPQLDLWVLVASRDISNQLIDSLSLTGNEFGIETHFIETGDDSPCSLVALCAFGQDKFIEHIQKFYPDLSDEPNIVELKAALTHIKSIPGYREKIDRLRKSFCSVEIGYNNWFKRQNQWLLEQLASAENSRSWFRQILNVNDRNVKIIERKEAYEQLDNWFQHWGKDKRIFTLRGEEGDGKTWTVASWVLKHIKHNKSSPVLFLNAQDVSSENISQTLSDAITRQLSTHKRDFWSKRIFNWMERETVTKPVILLVIDGLNENLLFAWRSFLENFNIAPWQEKIALLLTCRTKYWDRHLGKLSHIHNKTKSWDLPPYNDQELDAALKQYDLKKDDIPASLLPLIRKPRYFDMTVKYRERIAESGDVTVHRLLYEDFKDRRERKSNLNLTDDDFQLIMIGLARQARSGEKWFSDKDFTELITLENKREVLEELINSGVFIQDEVKKYKFRVDEKRLAHGLGLLLNDEVKQETLKGKKAIEECIDRFLEPQPEMDFKAAIVGSAVFLAMIRNSFPESGRLFLLRYYINLKNSDDEVWNNFQAYFPCSPETYFNLAELESKTSSYNSWLNRMFKYTFSRWCKEEKFIGLFKEKFENWLGWIELDLRIKDRWKEEHKRRLQEHFGPDLKLGPAKLAGYPVTLVEGGYYLPSLTSIALSVISFIDDRRPFVRAITIKALNNCLSIFGTREDEISWILRIVRIPLWPKLKKEILNLLDQDKLVATRAAYYLLTYERSPEAIELRNTLPDDLFGRKWKKKDSVEDPCKCFSTWSRDDYFKCLNRKDIELKKIVWNMKHLVIEPGLPVPKNLGKRLAAHACQISPTAIRTKRGRTEDDYFWESIQIFLFAFSPTAAVKIYRAIIRDMENREDPLLWRIVTELKTFFLILGEEEMAAVKRTWRRLHKKIIEKPGVNEDHSEGYLFWIALSSFSAITQLRLLLKRPEEAADYLDFFLFFKKLEPRSWDWVLRKLRNTNNTTELRRLLGFISKHPKDIPLKVLVEIKRYFSHSDNHIRNDSCWTFFKSENMKLMVDFISGGWAWKKENSSGENHVGSLILAEYGKDLSYEELRRRISLGALGFAVIQRGLKEDEFNKYIEDLNFVWENNVYGCSKTRVTDRENNKEILEAGQNWLSANFYSETLKEIIKIKPHLIQKWVNAVAGCSEPKETARIIVKCRSFYKVLCKVLFEVKPTEALKLYEKLTTHSIPGFDRDLKPSEFIDDLFRAEQIPGTEALWDEQFDECFVDLSLIELAVVNQKVKNTMWYQQKIDKYLTSNLLYVRAKGIMMLGFQDQESSFDKLNDLDKEIPECWIKLVIKTALGHWQHNKWAKAWFSKFLEAGDAGKAWASFKLFLKCVDRRCNIWKKDIMKKYQTSPSYENRELFLDLNKSEIKRAIEKNEEALKDTCFGIKISRDIAPWM